MLSKKWMNLDKKLILSTNLEDVNNQVPSRDIEYKLRVSDKDISKVIKIDEENQNKLVFMIRDLFFEKADGNFRNLDAKCAISESSLRKVIKKERPVTREFLAKFAVGLKVDEETAEELFNLQGYPLDPKRRFDYITMCAIRDKDDLEIYNNDLVKYNCKSIL